MNILHALGWYFPDPVGGTEIYVQRLARLQRDAGHRVAVTAPRPGGSGVEHYVHDGVDVYRFPIGERLNRAQIQHRAPAGIPADFEGILGRGWDVFHLHSVVSGLDHFNVEACRRHGIAVVSTNHLPGLGYLCQRGSLLRFGRSSCDGVAAPTKCAACELQHRGVPRPLASVLAQTTAPLGALGHRLKGRLGTAISMNALIVQNLANQDRLFKSTDRCVVLNQAAYDILIKNGAPVDRLRLNRLGISSKSVPKPGPDDSPSMLPLRFGYLGRITETKGVRHILRAIARLPRRLRFEMDFVGPTGSADDRALAAEIRSVAAADDRIRLSPAVAHATAGSRLAELDVLLCPSVGFENGPSVLLESHAVGTPVIGSMVGAMPELIQDGINGALVRPSSVDEIEGWIHRLCHEPAVVDSWRRRLGPIRTMDDVFEDYERMYRELVAVSSQAIGVEARVAR